MGRQALRLTWLFWGTPIISCPLCLAALVRGAARA